MIDSCDPHVRALQYMHSPDSSERRESFADGYEAAERELGRREAELVAAIDALIKGLLVAGAHLAQHGLEIGPITRGEMKRIHALAHPDIAR